MSPPKPRSLLPSSPAARFDYLHDLYAPWVETDQLDDDGEPVLQRDPSQGVISREEFMRLLENAS